MSSIAVSEFVIKVVSEIVVYHYDDSELTGFFHDAGVPQLPKSLNKVAVCRDYLRLANQGAGIDPLMILGRLLKRYMDDDRSFTTQHAVEGRDTNRERIACATGDGRPAIQLGRCRLCRPFQKRVLCRRTIFHDLVAGRGQVVIGS